MYNVRLIFRRYTTPSRIPATDLTYERQDPASFILDSLNTPWQPFHLNIPDEDYHSAPGSPEPSYRNILGSPPFWAPVPYPSYSLLPQFAREMQWIFDNPDIPHRVTFHRPFHIPPIPLSPITLPRANGSSTSPTSPNRRTFRHGRPRHTPHIPPSPTSNTHPRHHGPLSPSLSPSTPRPSYGIPNKTAPRPSPTFSHMMPKRAPSSPPA